MDPCYFAMNGCIPVERDMTPPPDGRGFFDNDHTYDDALPVNIFPDGKPATPESLPRSSSSRRRSLATTTTTTTSSSISVHTDSRPIKDHVHRCSFTSLHQPRDIVFSPRPIADLHAERTYLSLTLQKQSLRAAGLIREYCVAWEQLNACRENPATTGRVKRQLKKKLNLLKLKILKVGGQERAIGSRLGEVGVELQSREMWDRESQRCFVPLLLETSGGCLGGWGDDGCGPQHANPFSCLSTPLTSHFTLSPLSPSFIPGSVFPWSVAEESEESEVPGTGTMADEEFASNHGLLFTYCCPEDVDEVVDKVEARRSSMGGVDMACTLKRRLSLPNMSSLWAGEEAE